MVTKIIICTLTCLLHAYQIGFESDKYPIDVRLDKVDLVQHELDGSYSILNGYNSLPTVDNCVNNAIAQTNDDFGDQLDFMQECEVSIRKNQDKLQFNRDETGKSTTLPNNCGIAVIYTTINTDSSLSIKRVNEIIEQGYVVHTKVVNESLIKWY